MYKKLELMKPMAQTICKFLFWGILIFFYIYELRINSNNVEGRFALFMDERITYDGVRDILRSNNILEALKTTVNGDLRYGRILANLCSVVAWPFYHFGGEPGLIFSIRMTLATMLFTAYTILTFLCVKSWIMRNVTLLCLLSVGSTQYYMNMPKPEPVQLLFFAIFLFYFNKYRFCFGKYWFWLGITMGVKLSSLFFMPVFWISGIWSERKQIQHLVFYKRIFISLGAFFSGFLLSEGTIIKCFWSWDIQPLKSYFSMIQSEAVEKTLTLIERLSLWFNRWITYTLNMNLWLEAGLFFVIIFCFMHCWELLRRDRIEIEDNKKIKFLLVIFLAGICSLLPIFILIDRIYSFYLHLGTVLILVSGFGYCEISARNLRNKWWGTLIGTVIFAVFISGVCGVVRHAEGLVNYTDISTNLDYQTEKAKYLKLKGIIETCSDKTQRYLKVIYDPVLYQVDTTDKYVIQNFWTRFNHWYTGADILIYNSAYDPTITADDADRKAIYDQFVCTPQNISQQKCLYIPLNASIDGVTVMMRVDVYAAVLKNNRGIAF